MSAPTNNSQVKFKYIKRSKFDNVLKDYNKFYVVEEENESLSFYLGYKPIGTVQNGSSGGGGGIPEAPVNNEIYGRKNATWQKIEKEQSLDGGNITNYYEQINYEKTVEVSSSVSEGGINYINDVSAKPQDAPYTNRFAIFWNRKVPESNSDTNTLSPLNITYKCNKSFIALDRPGKKISTGLIFKTIENDKVIDSKYRNIIHSVKIVDLDGEPLNAYITSFSYMCSEDYQNTYIGTKQYEIDITNIIPPPGTLEILRGMFEYNNNIGIVKGFKDIDTSNVFSMSSMFRNDNCFLSNKNNLPLTFDTSSCEIMDSMFQGAKISGGILDLSNFDTSKLKRTHHMFSGIEFLDIEQYDFNVIIDLSSWTHESMEDKNYMWYNLFDNKYPKYNLTVYFKNQTELEYWTSSDTSWKTSTTGPKIRKAVVKGAEE